MAKRFAVKGKAGTLSPKYAANYDKDVPSAIEYPRVPLHAFLDDAADSYPGSTATIFYNAKKSYATLLRDAKRFSAGLPALGVSQGDPLPTHLPNSPHS